MESLLTALGLLLDALLNLPSRGVAINDGKKAVLAKNFSELIVRIDTIIMRGHEILVRLEHLLDNLESKDFNMQKEALGSLIWKQICEVHSLEYYFDTPITDAKVVWRRPAILSELPLVLSIYSPEHLARMKTIFRKKRDNLDGFYHGFIQRTLNDFRKDKMIITEIVSIDDETPKVFLQKLLSANPEDDNVSQFAHLIRQRQFNLAIPKQRAEYFARAKANLLELENTREQIAKFIREHYEPHYLL